MLIEMSQIHTIKAISGDLQTLVGEHLWPHLLNSCCEFIAKSICEMLSGLYIIAHGSLHFQQAGMLGSARRSQLLGPGKGCFGLLGST